MSGQPGRNLQTYRLLFPRIHPGVAPIVAKNCHFANCQECDLKPRIGQISRLDASFGAYIEDYTVRVAKCHCIRGLPRPFTLPQGFQEAES